MEPVPGQVPQSGILLHTIKTEILSEPTNPNFDITEALTPHVKTEDGEPLHGSCSFPNSNHFSSHLNNGNTDIIPGSLLNDFEIKRDPDLPELSELERSPFELSNTSESGYKRFSCKAAECPFKTDNYHSLKQHRIYHQIFHKFKGHLKCSYCSFCCNSQTTLTWHLFQHIELQNCRQQTSTKGTNSSFKCQYCFLKCDSRRALSLHLKQHKKATEVNLRRKASKSKDWKTKLKKYIRNCIMYNSKSKKKFFQCPKCPFRGSKERRICFTIHIVQHMMRSGHKCLFCTYKGVILGIKSHELVHLRKKTKFRCCICYNRIREESDLIKHLKSSHSINIDRLKVVLDRRINQLSSKRGDQICNNGANDLAVMHMTDKTKDGIKACFEEIETVSTETIPKQLLSNFSRLPLLSEEPILDISVDQSINNNNKILDETMEVDEEKESDEMLAVVYKDSISEILSNTHEGPDIRDNANYSIYNSPKSMSTKVQPLFRSSTDEGDDSKDSVKAVIFKNEFYASLGEHSFTHLAVHPELDVPQINSITGTPSKECRKDNFDSLQPNSQSENQKELVKLNKNLANRHNQLGLPSFTVTITTSNTDKDVIKNAVVTEILRTLELSNVQLKQQFKSDDDRQESDFNRAENCEKTDELNVEIDDSNVQRELQLNSDKKRAATDFNHAENYRKVDRSNIETNDLSMKLKLELNVDNQGAESNLFGAENCEEVAEPNMEVDKSDVQLNGGETLAECDSDHAKNCYKIDESNVKVDFSSQIKSVLKSDNMLGESDFNRSENYEKFKASNMEIGDYFNIRLKSQLKSKYYRLGSDFNNTENCEKDEDSILEVDDPDNAQTGPDEDKNVGNMVICETRESSLISSHREICHSKEERLQNGLNTEDNFSKNQQEVGREEEDFSEKNPREETSLCALSTNTIGEATVTKICDKKEKNEDKSKRQKCSNIKKEHASDTGPDYNVLILQDVKISRAFSEEISVKPEGESDNCNNEKIEVYKASNLLENPEKSTEEFSINNTLKTKSSNSETFSQLSSNTEEFSNQINVPLSTNSDPESSANSLEIADLSSPNLEALEEIHCQEVLLENGECVYLVCINGDQDIQAQNQIEVESSSEVVLDVDDIGATYEIVQEGCGGNDIVGEIVVNENGDVLKDRAAVLDDKEEEEVEMHQTSCENESIISTKPTEQSTESETPDAQFGSLPVENTAEMTIAETTNTKSPSEDNNNTSAPSEPEPSPSNNTSLPLETQSFPSNTTSASLESPSSPSNTILRCQYCPTKFLEQRLLKAHYTLHSAKKGIVCPLCTYRTSKTLILKHLLCHAGSAGSDYLCPLCDTKKRTKVNMHDHLKVTHSRDIFEAHVAVCRMKRSIMQCNGCC